MQTRSRSLLLLNPVASHLDQFPRHCIDTWMDRRHNTKVPPGQWLNVHIVANRPTHPCHRSTRPDSYCHISRKLARRRRLVECNTIRQSGILGNFSRSNLTCKAHHILCTRLSIKDFRQFMRPRLHRTATLVKKVGSLINPLYRRQIGDPTHVLEATS